MKSSAKPKSHLPQPLKSLPNDVKGKRKLVEESNVPTNKSMYNSKRVEREFIKNQIKSKRKQSDLKETKPQHNKIKVFTIKRKDETTLIKRTYLVIHDEQFDNEWYIDSGCSRHMTGRKEELREFHALKNGGNVIYGNNSFGTIKGYGMITNGDFSIRKVDYVEGLQHSLMSVSQLVA
ncbi:uncharacterized protein LOC111882061 [Lactuca sativa]|uniref:uncharacterized protein LOC111882061 n=1 Tax=Lactuca sativa TaxID=4236 RepID=UPI000CD82E69|nr:uncharacterized protein LOC111882061 [Lactuca sativa]